MALARTVHADPSPEQVAEAKRLFEEGTSAYNLAEYDKAVEKYKAAYRIVPNPYFIYNIAQAYRLAKDFDKSLQFYDSFLTQLPNTPNRAEVEGFMNDLKQQIAARDKAAQTNPKGPVNPGEPITKIPSPDKVTVGADSGTPTPQTPTDQSPHRPIYKKWWFWAGIGAVAVGATVLAVSASGGSSDPSTHFGRKDLF
jgi:tetratricopeptide (TPR) repeat protein